MRSSERFVSQRLAPERFSVAGPELARWLVAVVLVAAGVGLFFVYAPRTEPVVQLSVQEDGS